MKKETFLVIVIVFLLLLNLGTLGFLFFQNNKYPDFPPHPRRPDRLIIERLKLSPEQVEKFEELKFEHRSGMNKLEHEAAQFHASYFSLLKEDNYLQSAVDSFENLLAENQTKKDSITFKHFEDLKAICNEEQKKYFNELIEEIGEILTSQPLKRRP